jgi:hypothetical protein
MPVLARHRVGALRRSRGWGLACRAGLGSDRGNPGRAGLAGPADLPVQRSLWYQWVHPCHVAMTLRLSDTEAEVLCRCSEREGRPMQELVRPNPSGSRMPTPMSPSVPGLRSAPGPAPRARCHGDEAEDDEQDSDHEQDIAHLVDVESLAVHGGSQPHDGPDDRHNDPGYRRTNARASTHGARV